MVEAGRERTAEGAERRELAIESLLIVFLFALLVLTVDPRGDFPLDDDWNFALGTWWFAEHGEFRFARFTGMSLRAQVVWGAVWTRWFGESFEVLRASTLVLALGSLLVFHRFCARAGVGSFSRRIAVVALMAHPIFVWSSFTYMTQIPFLACTVAAVYCWARGAGDRAIGWFAAGSAALIASYFVRQSGIATIAAGAAALAVVWSGSGRRFRAAATALLAIPGALFLVMIVGTDLLHGRPEEFALRFGLLDLPPARAAAALAAQIARNFAFEMQYAVLSLLGVALAASLARLDRRELAGALLLAIPIAWGASELSALRGPLPYDIHGNVIVGTGFGPLTLRDTWIFGYPGPREIATVIRWLLTIGGAALASVCLSRIAIEGWRLARERGNPGVAVAAAAGTLAGGTAILFTTDIFFDRYALDAAWSLAFLLPAVTAWTGWRKVIAIGATLLVFVFSAVGTSDYLAWNRARWEGFGWLRARGVPLERMDGGYEINQYLIGGFDGPAFLRKPQFSVVDDEWILSFNEVAGYRTVARVEYERWSGAGTIHVQRRTEGFRPGLARGEGEIP
ncbi:MAG TPA: hypothetical protein VMS56_07925 [Thermoanaerobaculia bacterium]|nr:hypothetical protein [Thermoanaerobaculia bacterium]